jgi:hypothetical protein
VAGTHEVAAGVLAGEEHFLCRRCHDLVYRRIPQQESLAVLAAVQAAMGCLFERLVVFGRCASS